MKDKFRAATWNVYHGTPVEDLEGTVSRLARKDVSVLLIQEGSQDGLPALLKEHGYSSYRVNRQYVIAWTDHWTDVHLGGTRLADTEFYRSGKTVPVQAGTAILSDPKGRTIWTLSYHTPSRVQRGGPNEKGAPYRVQALREAMETLEMIADEAETHAVLFGGDDNVDESRGRGWRFMRWAMTGLRQVQATDPTHGGRKKGRRIDDFRVRGLIPGRGWTWNTPSDHRVHVRTFKWPR